MRRSSCVVSITAIVVAAGCSTDVGTGTVVSARDTVVTHEGADATVRIVESTPDTVQRWHVSDTPVLDIGGGESEGTSLFRVRGALRFDDGRIVVADGGSSQLRFFDAAGSLDTIVGGAGEGPSEFRDITFFGRLSSDSLLVWDLRLRRVTIFDASGARVREILNEPEGNVTGVFDDGSMLGSGFTRFESGPPNGLTRLPLTALRISADGTTADSIGRFAGSESFFTPFGNAGFNFSMPPFARMTAIAAAGDRLYVGDTERPEIRIASADGKPMLFVRWSDRGREITAGDVERAKQDQLGGTEPGADRENIERLYREMPMPEHMPVFSALHVARDGDIWVKRYRPTWEDGSAEWIVFHADGSFVTRVLLPSGLRPTDIGESYVLGIERDDLDVEHVRMYSLERRTRNQISVLTDPGMVSLGSPDGCRGVPILECDKTEIWFRVR